MTGVLCTVCGALVVSLLEEEKILLYSIMEKKSVSRPFYLFNLSKPLSMVYIFH